MDPRELVREALLTRPHHTILNLWTPTHIGMVGHELTDAAAKEVTEQCPDRDNGILLAQYAASSPFRLAASGTPVGSD
ncbi:hypothetical protein B0H17DRAFT_1218028 [Mycena rosella]|uniref:Uncharacterized protein n=1 Tax=Mycena rosella TaxID=1033263 RepID=A0AAD7BSS4_MYCRO|nr:hypothetical protein B0H17DRAFT_1218028 [Mycena rosella]